MQLGKLSGAPGRPEGGGRDRANSVALAALCLLLFLTFLDNTVVSVGLGSPADRPAGVRRRAAVGDRRLRPDVRRDHAGLRHDRRRARPQEGHADRRRASSAPAPCSARSRPTRRRSSPAGPSWACGAAASEPGTLSVIRQIYTDSRERAWAIGIWSAVSGLALALGPVIGGALVGAWSWRGIFWFNLFFGLVALIAAAVTVPESSDPTAVARRHPWHAPRRRRARRAHVRDHRRGDGELRRPRGDRAALRRRGARRRVRAVGAARRPPAARREALPAGALHRAEHRRVLHLPRDVRDLLLHRALPGGGQRRLRLQGSRSCSRR